VDTQDVSVVSRFGRYFKGEVIDLSSANHVVGWETYSFFNTLSKRLGSTKALPFILDTPTNRRKLKAFKTFDIINPVILVSGTAICYVSETEGPLCFLR
jgi:hypothetical protein